jgi:tripartite-type tricarboxylate transporter receptor subunit TctC
MRIGCKDRMRIASRWLAVAISGFVLPAQAQDWPTRPVTMVIPFAAGGAPDLLGRILAPRLAEYLGQSVIVENAGGAGGMTGAARVAKAPPDGYQLVLGTSGTHAANQTLSKHPLYNAATDFTPVALVTDQPVLLVARKDLPADTLPEFTAYAKANQAKMQYGSAGPGSGTHLACVRLNLAIGINVAHVPYRGGTPAMQDLVAGRIDYQCATGSAMAQIESSAVKAIAILAKERSPILPQLPSAEEQGLSGFEAEIWFAIFLPKGTPHPIVQKLHAATIAAINDRAVQERLEKLIMSVVAPERRSPEYLQKFVESEIEKWAGPIRASGVSTD